MMDCEFSDWVEAPASVTRPVFAIGDVHGCAGLLAGLHETIRKIASDGSQAGRDVTPLLVHLGDYIDRGPQPLATLEMALHGCAGIETVSLPGNHEQYLWRALTEKSPMAVLQSWMGRNGGAAAALELGYADPADVFDDPGRFLDLLRGRLGPDLLARFAALPRFVRQDGYLFVHAGIHPHIDLDRQLSISWHDFDGDRAEIDTLWIREPFLYHAGSFPENVIVVHGHTINAVPALRTNRIGIDTGAFMSGRLTAVELRANRLRFITAIGPPGKWVNRI
ncbi:MAG: serine/threonine protein phosphatase [Rhodospirillaceae bacterium]|nr:MAG: serine/threonine protein phosphatase [Rhodospirillaceae bacterium]